MTPRVSIVVATYNRRHIVGEAIRSCLAQTVPSLEVIVVDDASEDDTVAYLREHFGDEPRVRVLPRASNGGPADARNDGIAAAEGEFLGILDADDLYLPPFLRRHLEVMDAHPDVQLTISDARYEGAWPAARTTSFARRQPPTSAASMCAGGWILPCGALFRTEAIRSTGFEPGRRIQDDTEMFFRFFERGHRAHAFPDVLSVYRRFDASSGTVHVSQATERFRREALALAERFAHLAADPRAHRVRVARRRARHYLRFGPRREALRHAATWWRRRPWDVRAVWALVRAALRRGGPTASS